MDIWQNEVIASRVLVWNLLSSTYSQHVHPMTELMSPAHPGLSQTKQNSDHYHRTGKKCLPCRKIIIAIVFHAFSWRSNGSTLQLSEWKFILFSFDHRTRLLISFWSIYCSFNEVIWRQIVVSSAYGAILVLSLTQSNISLIKITKSKGPRMELWGTPDLTFIFSNRTH